MLRSAAAGPTVTEAESAFVETASPDPHRLRARRLLADHPEVRDLVGHAPVTALFVAALVALQTGLAAALAGAPWWAVLLAAYAAGAVVSLGLWVLVHECVHDLVFRKAAPNCALMLVANLPLLLPAATSFRKYHLMHHRFHGDPGRDGDVPSLFEARLVGRCPMKKAMWLFLLWGVQGLRPAKLQKVKLVDGWFVTSCALQLAYAGALWTLAGPFALLYLFLSGLFAVGLHPLGARWVQEHYMFVEGQETYSYYGPMNALLFNAGYHNEHHDLMRIPWMRLPRLKALAPELYEPLYAHRSWTALLFRFLSDPKITLFDRVVRPARSLQGQGRAA